MSPERKQIVIVSSIVPALTLPAILLTTQLHGVSLRAFVVCYALAMTALFAYVVSKLVKLKLGVR
jgi:hypothetical protein